MNMNEEDLLTFLVAKMAVLDQKEAIQKQISTIGEGESAGSSGATEKMVVQLFSSCSLNIAKQLASTISAGRQFHVDAVRAAEQCLRRCGGGQHLQPFQFFGAEWLTGTQR